MNKGFKAENKVFYPNTIVSSKILRFHFIMYSYFNVSTVTKN